MPEHRTVLHIDGSPKVGHLPRIEPFPDLLVGEKQHAVGVVREGGDAVGMEISQKRHCHTFIDIDIPERHGPTGAVPRTDGNLAALGDASLGKEDSKLLNTFCHIRIRKGFTLVVAECFLIPSLADGFLQSLQIVFHH